MNVVWSPRALDQVATIANEIAADRPAAADRWVDSTLAAVWRLASFPESGRMVPEVLGGQIREVISGSYRIIYTIEPSQVSVLTVRHQRQSTTHDDLSSFI